MAVDLEHAPLSEERLRPAIGPRADYYLRRWREMEAGGKKVSWNWAACFLNIFWFAYRKMWGPMLAMGVIYLVSSPLMNPSHQTLFKISVLVLIGLSFVTGGYGNWLYRARVERIVAETVGLDADAAAAREAARGGVSLLAALAALIVLSVLGAIAGMIPLLLAHGG